MKKIMILIVILGFYSCDNIATKITRELIEEATEEVAERTLREGGEYILREGSEEVVEKTTKEIIEETSEEVAERTLREGSEYILREGSEEVVGKSLKELASNDKMYKEIYEGIIRTSSQNVADDVVVKTTKNGIELVSKNFPDTKILIKNNTIFANAGSLKGAGPLNQFLSNPLPNKTYIVDDCFIYKTDEFGRVIYASADRTKAFNIERLGRDSKTQKRIKELLDGVDGDDAGHLFANSTGGPNELINQVPMSSNINRSGGLWRNLEELEEAALREGKNVKSSRKLLYKGNSKRPYAIEFTMDIDGVKTTQLIENI